jgi:hypothetical protein
MKYSRILSVLIATALVVVACNGESNQVGGESPADPDTPTTVHIDADEESENLQDRFPDPETWAADHPQPEDGVPFFLAITFNVGPTFEGESIEVKLDGEPIVNGSWVPPDDSDGHGCPDPYKLILEPGTHSIEAVTGSGETLNESFDHIGEANASIQYRHPDEWPELDEPTMVWTISEGPPICE